jgi:hypothetical protein
LRRGIPATPVLNGFCGDYEYGMDKSVIYESVFNYGWPKKNESSSAAGKLNILYHFFILALFVF